MFDKLVVSTAQRRRGRTAKFFVCTSIVYLSAVGIAFALSILLAEPRLADASSRAEVLIAPPPPPGPRPPAVATHHQDSESTPRPDPGNVMKYDDIAGHQQSGPPRIKLPTGVAVGATDGDPNGDPNGIPDSIGVGLGPIVAYGNASDPPPRPPDAPKAQTRPVDNRKPLPVSSVVLQGKAIERVVPVYPELPKRIRLQGEVSLEVIISPKGRVESVRIVSGHPMLVSSALEAARSWRFEPTLLNGVPVRVTGVITFVFKLNE